MSQLPAAKGRATEGALGHRLFSVSRLPVAIRIALRIALMNCSPLTTCSRVIRRQTVSEPFDAHEKLPQFSICEEEKRRVILFPIAVVPRREESHQVSAMHVFGTLGHILM